MGIESHGDRAVDAVGRVLPHVHTPGRFAVRSLEHIPAAIELELRIKVARCNRLTDHKRVAVCWCRHFDPVHEFRRSHILGLTIVVDLVSDAATSACRAARERGAIGSIHRDLTDRRCRC